ncbi:MAG: TonB-dependent receptor [Aequorivita sp.]|nr:TonB-dependent receptor [Aequorivita sp.]|tara:strand:+ start:111297 stop:113705 length:2409 start_codon:yes stop_codon:yes gene_type:complete
MKIVLTYTFCLVANLLLAQNFTVAGKVTDTNNTNLSFVNVLVFNSEDKSPIAGTTTNHTGEFQFKNLAAGTYHFNFSYVGFKTFKKEVMVSSNLNLDTVVLTEAEETLNETVVVGKKPTIVKTSGKLVFNVENTTLAVGSTMDLLKKTPGVVVIGENIQIKFSSPVIYINGKRVYLSDSEVVSLLENTDASNIKAIEVITNPDAQFDADAGTVLNIITTKAISVGYKGAINTTYSQGIYPKFSLGTSHFYKNKWLNLYASYTYNNKKEFKEDFHNIRYFEPNEITTKSVWDIYFSRTTKQENHNGNLILDFTLDENNTIGLTSNISITPKSNYHNNGRATIYNGTNQLDSTNTTLSHVGFLKDNFTMSLEYKRKLNAKGATLSAVVNYIYFNRDQDQSVSTNYFLPNNEFIRNNSFLSMSAQKNNIFTGQADFASALFGGSIKAGVKLSNIDTKSKLNFYITENNSHVFSSDRSDNFNYKENIYAQYFNFEKEWDKWSLAFGLRGEYTVIDAISNKLGETSYQSYFDLFPTASVNYTINDKNTVGLSYNRSIERPRYESLNPFKYYITENNYIGGDPNLVPSIKDKITLSYSYNSNWIFDLYYENVSNELSYLSFQHNENQILRSVYANLTNAYQYSFDIVYYKSFKPWWYFQIVTSSFYLSNKFEALESSQQYYTNDTFGQYFQTYNSFTLSKEKNITASLSALYISNFVFGNRYFKNQSTVNISLKKDLWDKRASVSVSVDDLFNSLNNVASMARYYNQDNHFYTDQENRLIRVGFKYNFGNARLRDNNKTIETAEGDRL